MLWETPPPPLSHAPDGPEIENDFMAESGEGSSIRHLKLIVTIAMGDNSDLFHFREPQEGMYGLQ